MTKSTPLVQDRASEMEGIDRISVLPEELLLRITSFLPTYWAARCSVISRHFYHLWEATHLKENCSLHVSDLDDCPLLHRSTSYPVHHLTLRPHYRMTTGQFSSLLLKVQSLGVRHLRIERCRLDQASIFPLIFSFSNLLSLSLDFSIDNSLFPFDMSSSHLKRLSLTFNGIDCVKFRKFISNLYSLEELFLDIDTAPELNLTSQSVKQLELTGRSPCFQKLGLSIPNLESLDVKIAFGPFHFSGEMPQLTKAYICIGAVQRGRVPAICELLKSMKNVENLKLDLREYTDELHPFHMLLELGKEPPIFPVLKFLDLRCCFHEESMEDLDTLLQNSPVLESLMLIHQGPNRKRKRDRKPGFRSRLPRNVDGNFQIAYFEDLHIEENMRQLMGLLAKKRTSDRVKK